MNLYFLIFMIGIALLTAGCSQKQDDLKNGEQVITYNLGAEPETLDPATATGKAEATVQMAVFEGLTRLDKDNKPVPGMAKDWEISDDGTRYTFHLRDAKWSNGEPVTAYDFEYAWKRLLSPETGAYYAYQLWYIKNGKEYTDGNVSADEVGVRAIDDKTLEVELIAPTPYFLSLTAFSGLYPVNKNIVQSNPDWHTGVDTYVGNGPFKLAEWKHNQKLVLLKNPNYWAADDVKLDKIVMTMAESRNTELTMFETGQIDIAEEVPAQEIKRLLDEGTASIHPDLSSYFSVFNTDNDFLKDKRVRRALAMAINRQSLIDNVAQGFQKPAYAFVPNGVPGINGDFREEGGDYFQENVERARELLAQAGYPNGDGAPTLELMYDNRGDHQKLVEAIQEMWKSNLNIDVKLKKQEWGVYLKSLFNGDYQIAMAGWNADYVDAMTFLDMWVSDSGNNVAGWRNSEYDRLIEIAKTSFDNKKRIAAMHDAEKILLNEMPFMPIYFYTNVNMYKPWVKGVVVPTIGGFQEFRWAYVEK